MSNPPDPRPPQADGHGGAAPSLDDSDRDPVEQLAQEFAERHRRGESPTIEEYTEMYPQLADEIRELFPTIAAIEKLTERKQRRSALSDFDPLTSLQQIGDFRVVGEIGRGGMGIVLEAEQVTLGRRVAVKVLPPHALRSPKELQRFYREAQTAAKLHHTNIVPVFGVGEQDGIHYIVMQLIQGVGLDRVLGELRRLVLGPGDESDAHPTTDDRSSHARRNAAALLREELRPSSGVHPAATATRSGWAPSETVPLADPSDIDRPTPAPADDHQAAGSGMASQLVLRPLGTPAGVELIGAEYWRNVARIGIQVCSALQYAHAQGTLHRDIKPANLLLDNTGVVWVADFGLAKAVEQGSVTWTGDIVGTLSYMAPERFDGHADARSDIYSLGLTLYELATLQRAHGGRDRAALIRQVTSAPLIPPRKHHPAIPRDLETIILKAAAREPGDRYESAQALADDLQCLLEDRPIRARRAAPAERVVRWCRRNRMVAGLAATVVMLMMLVTAAIAVGYAREARQRQRSEAIAELAISFLDRIYGQFAPSPLRLSQPATPDESGEAMLMEDHTHLPLSTEVATLLESLLQFYDRLAAQTNDDQRVLLRFITANGRMGAIHHRLGELNRAQQAYQRAIETAGRIGGQFGDQAQLNMELARLYNGLGMVLKDQFQFDQAYSAHQKAEQLLAGLPQAPGDAAEVQYELAHTLYLSQLADWGRAHQWRARRREREREGRRENAPGRNALARDNRGGGGNGDRDRNAPPGEPRPPEPDPPNPAARPVDRAVKILLTLIDQHPGNPDYQFLLARCYLASGDGRRGGPDCDPEECDQKAIAILEDLVQRYPEFPDYQYELGATYARREFWRILPRRRRHQEDPEDLARAEERLRKALATTRDLELNHPNIPQYLGFKGRLHWTLGRILRDEGNLQEAEQNLRDAVERLRLVRARVQDQRWPQIDLARTRIDLADVRRQLGRLDEAEAMLTSQVTELQDLLTQFPERDWGWWFVREHLENTYRTLEDILRDRGENQKADEMAQKAQEL